MTTVPTEWAQLDCSRVLRRSCTCALCPVLCYVVLEQPGQHPDEFGLESSIAPCTACWCAASPSVSGFPGRICSMLLSPCYLAAWAGVSYGERMFVVPYPYTLVPYPTFFRDPICFLCAMPFRFGATGYVTLYFPFVCAFGSCIMPCFHASWRARGDPSGFRGMPFRIRRNAISFTSERSTSAFRVRSEPFSHSS